MHLGHFRLLTASWARKPWVADLPKGLGQKVSEEMFEGIGVWNLFSTLERQDGGNPRTEAARVA